MYAFTAFVLFSFLACCSAYNVEVNTKTVVSQGRMNNSFFGFSLTLHSGKLFSDKPTIFVGAPRGDPVKTTANVANRGEIVECVIDGDVSTCKHFQIDSSAASDVEPYEHRESQWMGATVSSNGDGAFIVCAPRYSEIDGVNGGSQKYNMIGKCKVNVESRDRRRMLYPCTLLDRDHPIKKTRSQDGFCEAGFSAVYRMTSGTAVIGAIGGRDQKGTVLKQKRPKATEYDFSGADGSGTGTSDGFYLGYAVTYGNFYSKDASDPSKEAIAASIPRLEYSGKVIVYHADDFAVEQSISPPTVVKDREEYIYFGTSLCAVDVNGDGYADLLVGAPFYSERNGGDEGRVYIYLSTETRTETGDVVRSLEIQSDDTGLSGDNNRGARFGWAIAKAGDLNFDGVDDFIVGAPQDQPDVNDDGYGDGAVYIYHGRKDGKFSKAQQKISAKTVENSFSPFMQFGSAIAGNVDTNNDDYPDIAIGAWESNRVILLRTRPVMHVAATLSLSKQEIPVENFTADCKDNSSSQCLDAVLCFSYQGKSVTGQHELKYTMEFDKDLSLKSSKRVYLEEGGTRVYEKTGSVTLDSKGATKCVNFSQIRVVEGNKLTETLRQGTTDIVFQAKYELVSPPECLTTELCPVLDASVTPVLSKKATLVFNCSDNRCDFDLNVGISLSKDEIIIGDKDDDLTATIELSNFGEISYNPEVKITHDRSLKWQRILTVDQGYRIEQSNDNSSTASDVFRLHGPLDTNKKVSFKLGYSTRRVIGDHPTLDIFVKATGASGRELNDKDNNATATIRVKRQVIMEITGTSLPRFLNYPASTPALDIKTDGNRTDFSSVNVSAIGPEVKVTIELKNKGFSPLKNVALSITYPLRTLGGREQDFIVYPISITEKGDGDGTCLKSNLNPANLNLSSMATTSELKSRKKRDVEVLRLRTSQARTFICQINELKLDDRFSVDFQFYLWTATLVQFYAKDIEVKIEVNARYTDSLDPGTAHQEFGSVDIKLTPENLPGKSKSTPVWIIIVAVLGGVLLLAIAILALFKLGFFKRNRPPQDISDPQTDDVPVVAAT